MSRVVRLPTPDPGPFAEPRPPMRGRYVIQNAAKALVMALLDALLALLSKQRADLPVPGNRILLSHWAHLGDVTTVIGAVRSIRRTFPKAHIGMIVSSLGLRAIENLGLIDEFYVIDHWKLSRARASFPARYRRYRAMVAEVTRRITANGYDVGIDFYFRFPPAHPLFRKAGIPLRAGFVSTGWGPLLTHGVAWPDADAPIADHYQSLLRGVWPQMALSSEQLRPRLPSDRLEPLPEVLANNVPYVVFHPGAGAPFKDWGSEKWEELLRCVRGDARFAQHSIVLTGAGPVEAHYAELLLSAAPWAINLAGKASWSEFVSIVAHAEAVVCPDTVTTHVAAAFDVPVVSLFTGTNNPRQWGPNSANGTVLTQDVVCAPCHRGCERMACIRDIRPSDVAHHLLLALTAEPQR